MKGLISIILLLFATTFSFAQEKTIKGKVTDQKDGTVLAGVSVLIKGTSQGTTTNADGSFTLKVPSSAKTVQFSILNYDPIEVSIGNKTIFDVKMTTTEASLKEVVVVGYTRTTKEAFTGSAKTVSDQQITNKNVSNISQALAGEVAGVRVINSSGQPGSSATIRIRGFGSVNGNRSPLYVVDGVPFTGSLNAINPNDIASTTVLKDAAATAIYGSRGANGVIVITTKTGRARKSFIEADTKFGVNEAVLPRYEVIRSPEEYIGLSWEALYNEGVLAANANPTNYANTRLFSANGIDPRNNMWKNITSGAQLIDPVTRRVLPGATRLFDPENWADYSFQSSNRLESNLRFGGGDSKTNFYTSFGYLNDIGYSVKTDFRRLNGKINLNHEVKKWLTTNFNLNYSNTTSNNNGQGSSSNSVFWFADNMPSIYPLFMRDANGDKIKDPIFGGYRYDYGETGRKFGSLTNAISDANFNVNRTFNNELTGSTSANLKFNENLSLENRLGAQYNSTVGYSLTNKFYGSAASQNGSIFQSRNNLMNLNLLNMLRYNKRIQNHNIDALVAHESTKYEFEVSSAGGQNLVSNYDLSLANAIVKNPTQSSYKNTNNLESYFSQITYDYDGTYYVAGTVRRDGSSRFAAGKQWGTFGSIGTGWVVSKMPFMNNSKLLNYLKFKASYGILGDQSGLGFYPSVSSISIGNLNNLPSFGIPTPGNPDLTWETSKMLQFGTDFRLGKFLEGTIEYYIKNTDNLIFDRRVGISNGYASITVNDGLLRNEGVELELTGHILKGNSYFLDLTVNAERFDNKIIRMPLDPSIGNKPKIIDVQGTYAWSQGRSIFDFYIRNFVGVDAADGASTWTVYYDDLNSDGLFQAGEQVLNLEQFKADSPAKFANLKQGITKNYTQATQYYIGKTSIPKVRGAFNLAGGFKGFEIAAQLLYSFGGYAYDGAYAGLMANGLIGGNNWHIDMRNRWQKAGDKTDIPRLSNNRDANVNSASSRFLTKANYLALNNIRLGYNLPSSSLKRAGIEGASFFVSGDNLWLSSSRIGFNPSTSETGGSDTYRYSPLSTLTVGFKIKF
jgi:TonB-linked SusC/RagA family outer membrane protein